MCDMSKRRSGKVIKTKLVGVSFSNDDGSSRQEAIRRNCRAGSTLLAVKDDHNPRDENAIGVWLRDRGVMRQIGHLSSEIAADLAPFLRSGGALRVTVLERTGGSELTAGVNVEVRLTDAPAAEISEEFEAYWSGRPAPVRRGDAHSTADPQGEPASFPARQAMTLLDVYIALENTYESCRKICNALRVYSVKVYRLSLKRYRSLPDWAKPVVWGAGIAAPLVAGMFVVRAWVRRGG